MRWDVCFAIVVRLSPGNWMFADGNFPRVTLFIVHGQSTIFRQTTVLNFSQPCSLTWHFRTASQGVAMRHNFFRRIMVTELRYYWFSWNIFSLVHRNNLISEVWRSFHCKQLSTTEKLKTKCRKQNNLGQGYVLACAFWEKYNLYQSGK